MTVDIKSKAYFWLSPMYKIVEGTYFFYREDNGLNPDLTNKISFAADLISVMFLWDGEEIMFLKHGPPENIEKILQTNISKSQGTQFRFFSLTGKWDVNELNNLINCTGYEKKFLEFHKINPLELK